MDSLQLAAVALLVGAVIGAGAVLLVVVAQRARDRGRQRTSSEVPAGVAAMLETLDDPAGVVDPSFTVLAASLSAGSVGIVTGEVVDGAQLRALVRSARQSGVAESETMRIRRPGLAGDDMLVRARASALGARLALLIVRDITEQERVEQMRRDFVANTSHELKTPVGAVSLLAEAIESAADDPPQVRAFATRLQAEASRLGQLTARIMNLSKLQAADEPMLVGEIPVDEVVASSVDAHLLQAAAAGVTLVRGGDRGLFVRGDTQILIEAVGNLIANAITYSPRGSRVGVGVTREGEVVEIMVTDQGIGISEADQGRVFERFYRSDQARSRSTGGSGLGLSIVKHAVQRHGGEVRLWSRPGRGSSFTIRLPLVAGPGEEPRRRSRTTKRNQARAASLATIKGGDKE